MILLWAARVGWLLAAWALVNGRPQVAAIGLVLLAPHVALWVIAPAPTIDHERTEA